MKKPSGPGHSNGRSEIEIVDMNNAKHKNLSGIVGKKVTASCLVRRSANVRDGIESFSYRASLFSQRMNEIVSMKKQLSSVIQLTKNSFHYTDKVGIPLLHI